MAFKIDGSFSAQVLLANRAGFYSWDLIKDSFYGDGVVAAFFGLDETAMDQGVPIKALFDRIHGEDRANAAKLAHHAVISADPFQIAYRIVRQDGSIFQVFEMGRCLHFIDGVPSICAGVIFEANPRDPIAAANMQ